MAGCVAGLPTPLVAGEAGYRGVGGAGDGTGYEYQRLKKGIHSYHMHIMKAQILFLASTHRGVYHRAVYHFTTSNLAND